MSKYFDITHKRPEPSSTGSRPSAAELAEVIEVVRHRVEPASGAPADLNTHRFSKCRKITLPDWKDQPIVFHRNGKGNELASEAYRMLRTRLMRLLAASGNRSIVVSSCKPAEGKTLTTLNLAMCCAQISGLRILVIDADLRRRGVTAMLGELPEPGLAQLLQKQCSFEETIHSCNIPNLFFMAAGATSVSAPELFAGTRWKELIGWCAESFQIILVDAPPILPLSDFELIAQGCDNSLIVVRAHGPRREDLKNAARHIDPNKLIGVVFNQADLPDRSEYDAYYGGAKTR
jgi:capsular exopolysaccharide synthesis family protein